MANQIWQLDAAHSEIEFKVKHMMISNVKGNFKNFTLQVDSEGDDFKNGHVKVIIDAKSIDTKSEQRDTHLKSVDFFDVEKFPNIVFESTSFDGSKLTGNLTIKNIAKSIILDVNFGGLSKDPWGNVKAGFTVNGKINRSDFGLTWNAALETGGVMVSDEVKFTADIELTKS